MARLAEDTFKILIATDNHLGYAEKDPIRENDSYITFEEILKTAVERDVDFILLGGDLFHDAKPNPYCYQKCTELIRKYCFGDRPIAIEFLSDQSLNFHHLKNPIVNYEDSNLNVSIPIFTIHGNHDDPIGQNQISALDVLASCGLVNYFGRWTDMTYVEVKPLLMQKGETKLAIYGLSHIRDERLGRLFRQKKVVMVRPEGDDWFNVLVLHQNRQHRGVKNFIPECAIPDFFHVVIWGHEHDCRIEIEETANFFMCQPGSSIATSLSSGEAIEKKIAVMTVNKTDFMMDYIALKTVRPFMYEEMYLMQPDDEDFNSEHCSEEAEKEVRDKVLELIEDVKRRRPNSNILPLIRIRVNFYMEDQQFNPVRFGQKFVGQVANPQDMVILKHCRLHSKTSTAATSAVTDEDDYEDVQEWAKRVEDVVTKRFADSGEKLKVLTVKGITEAVMSYIDKNDGEAISYMVSEQSKTVLKKLIEMDADIAEVNDCIEKLRSENPDLEDDEIQRLINNKNRPRRGPEESDPISLDSSSENEESDRAKEGAPKAKPARGRGSRGGRGSRRGSRSKAQTLF